VLLQCVAVCCSVLQCVAVWLEVDLMCLPSFLIQSDLCIVYFYCSVLQCVAVCCSMLQCEQSTRLPSRVICVLSIFILSYGLLNVLWKAAVIEMSSESVYK